MHINKSTNTGQARDCDHGHPLSPDTGIFRVHKGDLPTRAERQREYRESMRRLGYKRLDVWISPKLWAKLEPHLGQFKNTHPGASLVEFLEELEIERPE